jgi:hypothetical protein
MALQCQALCWRSRGGKSSGTHLDKHACMWVESEGVKQGSMKSNLIKCQVVRAGCENGRLPHPTCAGSGFASLIAWMASGQDGECSTKGSCALLTAHTHSPSQAALSLTKLAGQVTSDECVVTLSPLGKSHRVVQHHVALPYRCRGRLGQEEAFRQVRERACSFATDLALLALAVCARCRVWATQVSRAQP